MRLMAQQRSSMIDVAGRERAEASHMPSKPPAQQIRPVIVYTVAREILLACRQYGRWRCLPHPSISQRLPASGTRSAARNAIDSERPRSGGFTRDRPSRARHRQESASSNLCTRTSEAYYMAPNHAGLETNRCLRPNAGST